jgi:hypothetical protein
LNHCVQVLPVKKGQNGTLYWCDKRWEHKIGSLSIFLSLLETVFKDAIDDSTNTWYGKLNNAYRRKVQ